MAALRAAGLDPHSDMNMVTQKVFCQFTKSLEVSYVNKNPDVLLASRAAVQSAIIQHCMARYPNIRWLFERKFIGLSKAATADQLGIAVLEGP